MLDWPHNEVTNTGSNPITTPAARENLRHLARLYLAIYLAEGGNGRSMLTLEPQAETADDIDFGRSDCEFLFRD